MNKHVNTTRRIIIVMALLLLGIIGWFIWSQNDTRNEPNKQTAQPKTQKYVTFGGMITGINNGCAHDDICTVSVDGKAIVNGGGLSSNPGANVYGITDADLAIGDEVNVKALNSDHGLTLQGCRECYITRGKVRGQ